MTTQHLSRHMDDPKSLCIFRLSAIGDVTHMVPVVKTLQNRFPDCQITWVVGALEHKLLSGLPGVRFIVFNKSKGFSALWQLRKQLKDESFDVLLLMQLSLRANLMSLMINAKRRIGFDRERSKEGHHWVINESIPFAKDVHVLDGFMQFATHLGCDQPIMDWQIPVSEEDVLVAKRIINAHPTPHSDSGQANVDDVLQGKRNIKSIHITEAQQAKPDQPKVIISPCSSHPLRNWLVERNAALIDHLVNTYDARVFLCGGPSAKEKAFIQAIEAACSQPVLNLAGQDTLKQLLCLMRMVDLVISPDSGPLHMAGAVGTPVIGLLAASNHKRSGSYQFPGLTVDAYPEACLQFLNKPVDELKWGTKTEFPGAMDLIELEAVKEKVAAVLGKNKE